MTAREKAQAQSDKVAELAREAVRIHEQLGEALSGLGEALDQLEAEYNRCPIHGDQLGVYGCPGCNAGKKWAEDQRRTPVRPRFEGGR